VELKPALLVERGTRLGGNARWTFIDGTERRTWFLFEASRASQR